MITVPKKYAIAVLQGRGMTELEARRTVSVVRSTGLGHFSTRGGLRHVPVTYNRGKYTIGRTW